MRVGFGDRTRPRDRKDQGAKGSELATMGLCAQNCACWHKAINGDDRRAIGIDVERIGAHKSRGLAVLRAGLVTRRT